MANDKVPGGEKPSKPIFKQKSGVTTQQALSETLVLAGTVLAGTLASKLLGKLGAMAGLPVMYYGIKTGNLPIVLGGAGMLAGGGSKSQKPEKNIEDRFENWLDDLKEKFLISDLMQVSGGGKPLGGATTEKKEQQPMKVSLPVTEKKEVLVEDEKPDLPEMEPGTQPAPVSPVPKPAPKPAESHFASARAKSVEKPYVRGLNINQEFF